MVVIVCSTSRQAKGRGARWQTQDQPGDAVADVRREQMLAAAAQLIAERGFSETRIADVARRVGASPALVIYYFGTKDSLLTEALRWSERRSTPAADEMLLRTTSLRAAAGEPGPDACVPEATGQIRRLGAVVRPLGAGVPAPRGRRRTGPSSTSAGAT